MARNGSPKNVVDVVVEELDAIIAANYLSKLSTQQRNLRPAVVERLADDILAGRWMLTHQAIAFDTHGNLIDGQHRLAALIAADKRRPGVKIQVMVARGCDPATFTKIDMHSIRDASDLFVARFRGEHEGVAPKNAKDMTTISNAMLRGMSPSGRSSRDEIAQHTIQHYEIIRRFTPLLDKSSAYSPAVCAAFIACALYFGEDSLIPMAIRWRDEAWLEGDVIKYLHNRLLKDKLARNTPRNRRETYRKHEAYSVSIAALRADLCRQVGFSDGMRDRVSPTSRDVGCDFDVRIRTRLAAPKQPAAPS